MHVGCGVEYKKRIKKYHPNTGVSAACYSNILPQFIVNEWDVGRNYY